MTELPKTKLNSPQPALELINFLSLSGSAFPNGAPQLYWFSAVSISLTLHSLLFYIQPVSFVVRTQRYWVVTIFRILILRQIAITMKQAEGYWKDSQCCLKFGVISHFIPRFQKQAIQLHVQFSSVQSLSHVQLFATPWSAAHQASLSVTNSRSSLRLTSIESVMPSSHLILCRPLPLLPSYSHIFASSYCEKKKSLWRNIALGTSVAGSM